MKPSVLLVAFLFASLTCFAHFSVARPGHTFEEGCGVDHHNQSCGEPYPCCSNAGHCGDNVYYCAPGNCQSEFGTCWDNVPPPPPSTLKPALGHSWEEGCGVEHHNQSCGEPYPCCSNAGHCGDSVYYCAPGNCQSEFGTCWDNVPPPPPSTLTPALGHSWEEGCGVEHHNQSCGEPYPCCSNAGHCGDSVYYCAPSNCQSEFGTCWENVPPPPPSTPTPALAHTWEEGCGVEHHNQSCGEPYPCCSNAGHCGDSVYYCAPSNCQSEFGTCWENLPPPPPSTLTPALAHSWEEGCGVEHHNQSCGEPYPCCSNAGHCGDSVYYCAPSNCQSEFGTCWDNVPPPPPSTLKTTLAHTWEEGCGVEHQNQSCGEPYPCCSNAGHCGDSVYYCAPSNCQSEFGTCWDNVPPPPANKENFDASLIGQVFDKLDLLNQF